MVDHRCCNTVSCVRYGFESQYAYKASGDKTTRSSELLGNVGDGDAYHTKTFAVGVVQRRNRSTLTTRTVTIKTGCNICMYRIRVILIWVGIDHPVYYF